MGRLIYSMGVSLDGYTEDESGNFDWAAPGDEVHRRANQDAEEAAALLYGRRMYEIMEGYWPAAAAGDQEVDEVGAEFARAYVATPRIVFSDTLESVSEGTRLIRRGDALEEAKRLKREYDGPLGVGGNELAASLFDEIDEFHIWVNPVVVGGGKPFFPQGREQVSLRLLEETRYPDDTLWLSYERT
jgi:dihydrofolate reductase